MTEDRLTAIQIMEIRLKSRLDMNDKFDQMCVDITTKYIRKIMEEAAKNEQSS